MKYQVICADWKEEFDSPHGFTFECETNHPTLAVDEYLGFLQDNSNFADGYPSDSVYQTKNENGLIESFLVGTDWSPEFWITKAP